MFIPLHEKFLQFDWLRAVVFQLNLKYPHVKITKFGKITTAAVLDEVENLRVSFSREQQ